MNQLVLEGSERPRWAPAAEPLLPGPAGCLVRPLAAATCDFDHLIVSRRMELPGPIALGHEMVAEVVETGDDVGRFSVGDTVIVPFQVSCGTCRNCTRGLTNACTEVPWLSCFGLGPLAGDWGGAVSDLVAVPWADAMLVPLPTGVAPADAAALSCNVPDAYRAVRHVAERQAASVLVTGGAFANISHYAVLLARALGARVDYLSPDADQSSKAERLGARVLDSADEVEPEAYEVTIDNSQDAELLAVAVRGTAPAGVLTSTTMYPDPRTPVPLMDMFARGTTFITGQPHVRRDIGEVLPLLADGAVDLALVTSAVTAWEDAPDAFAAGSGKVVCTRS